MEAAESRGLRGKRRAGGCPRERTGRARSLRRSLADQARHIVAVSHRKRHLNALVSQSSKITTITFQILKRPA
eukprot:5801757-Pyramimonas_sp.AAC.3